MNEEKKTVETREVGYRWHITLDREVRVAGVSKQYPDKVNFHAALEGHEETQQAAVSALSAARKALEEATKQEPETTSPETTVAQVAATEVQPT